MIFIWFLLQPVMSHSWIACADYSLKASTTIYDESQCLGFARGYAQFVSPIFGEDRGFNFDTTLDKPPCRQMSPLSYSDKYHPPVYRPGNTVRLVWPSKNHVSDICTNMHIPDTQLKLFYHCKGSNAFGSLGEFLGHSEEVIDWKTQGNRKGFQNCANFCSNPDKAVCHQDFIMPVLPQNTTCTFLWLWEFNPGSPPYTMCWDIATNPNSPPTPTSTQPGVCADLYDQCGGKNWQGPRCCKKGICDLRNEWYSQCIPEPHPTKPLTPPPTEICNNKLWGQCDGLDFVGSLCCPPNSQCVKFNEFFFQCIPKCAN